MPMDQFPAKEFMRRLASIDKSLSDIAKYIGHIDKILNRQSISDSYGFTVGLDDDREEEEDNNEM